ncbi:MAG: co-chaperone GroES [Candidatus Magasanikbacteria bacterium RIFCSPHIGHO2_01_FULL_41_23]|uniref:Co-chaperonin GroES n=1 Tax=Candidatus Magasanikbacteria bacterium RIFCSPLOWO2_01_FULL_40_15 TaxID=1798686 RepID=A0A1F6N498_9BACT|nr:MAG: co-chaperone GroES [Candidatus Magasanikbacteria bacterium RIFCSPHIGHO2_01_FULL_41_23]OGH67174.1 MAG: co-chaperone GroES [Candidatus Magasanikbacteria bacterium RIFCSPHIGHO2_02_FULL_41_35]OGH75461.1 MAG: co-chaperone GroES [Candidatus Magasanikbacteria bacterium RIFCSPHIGHO2_12_FULL_41_16]OGH78711.1 MAG: co-chaperone GroES [Candidatus Magasanikbacteria bacterium RIFCSPLOWO2_01_FULL_40_15]
MTIKPLGDHVVVKLVKEEEITASGIVLPDTVDKEKKAEGEIVAVGPGKLLESGARGAMEVKVGDRVLIKKWGGDEVEVEKQEYKIVSQEDILAVLEK